MKRSRRRAIAFAFVIAAPLVVVAAACSFPEVTFGPIAGPEGGTPDSPTSTTDSPTTDSPGPTTDAPNTSDAMSDADAADPGALDASDLFDGGAIDADTRKDGEDTVVDASICSTRPLCDCDNDTYRDEACAQKAIDAGDASLSSTLKPNDCDDREPLRNPGEDFHADPVPAGATHGGDWNCNTAVERKPPINLKCTATEVDVLLPLPHKEYKCGGGVGYLGAPACGAVADTYTCPSGQLTKEADCFVTVPHTTGVTANCK